MADEVGKTKVEEPTTNSMSDSRSSLPSLFNFRMFLGRTIFRKYRSMRTRRIGLKTLVKFGSRVDFFEADTMQYVAKHTSIPIPTVHDVWRVDGITYIVMDLVQGVELEYAWRRMSERAKERVVAQLTDYLAQLRALPPIVDGVISSIHGKYLRDHGRVGLGAYGPFKSHDDFHRYLRINFSLDDFQKLPESNEVMIAHRQQYTTKLTHGDLAPRNILVKMDGTVTAILDWDSAGWFPEYWEYTKAHFAPYAPQDWVSRIGDITGRYEQELEAERQLYELCGYYIT